MMKNLFITSLMALFLLSCSSDDNNSIQQQTRTYGIFTVQENNQTVTMNGTIGSATLNNFNNMLARYPNINLIQMQEVPGSMDDDINLQVSLKVFQNDIDTELLANGEIASGGVDFFLAGVHRTIGSNTRIGVHSWSDGTNDATFYPVGHAFHQPYINYYQNVGFTATQASDFYYFTINAAPASGIHWMTSEEITTYNFIR